MSISSKTFAVMALFGTAALAAPGKVERRATPVRHQGSLVTPPAARLADDSSDYDFAGAIYQGPSSQTFTSVTATFTMPKPSVPSGDSSSMNYYFSLWAGIQGGYNANEGLLQTGCDINTQKQFNNGANAFQCWVEYFPNAAVYIDMYPSVGDKIAVGVQGLSPTSGVVHVSNLNSGKSFTSTMTAPAPSNTILGPANIAESLMETTPTPTIPAFSPAVTFTNANILNSKGAKVAIGGGPSEIVHNGHDETNSTISSNSVVIRYV